MIYNEEVYECSIYGAFNLDIEHAKSLAELIHDAGYRLESDVLNQQATRDCPDCEGSGEALIGSGYDGAPMHIIQCSTCKGDSNYRQKAWKIVRCPEYRAKELQSLCDTNNHLCHRSNANCDLKQPASINDVVRGDKVIWLPHS